MTDITINSVFLDLEKNWVLKENTESIKAWFNLWREVHSF
jgi:hypothetical protein